jgi:hypothetical protein
LILFWNHWWKFQIYFVYEGESPLH